MLVAVVLVTVLTGCDAVRAMLEPAAAPTAAPLVLAGDVARGAVLYAEGKGSAPACLNCHAIEAGAYSLAPAFVGAGQVLAARQSGLSVADYVRQSIVEPGAFLVGGYRNIMYGRYGQDLTPQEIEDLVAYVLSLP
jgi:mono/diheme cytochrome c family protein